MANDRERQDEIKAEKRLLTVARLLSGGLDAAVATTGYHLDGFTFKNSAFETLLILKGCRGTAKCVAFVGGRDPASCLLKARKLCSEERLVWREDKWAPQEG